jgi:hypothetical protein
MLSPVLPLSTIHAVLFGYALDGSTGFQVQASNRMDRWDTDDDILHL